MAIATATTVSETMRGAEHRLSIAVAGSPNPRWQGHRMRVTAGSASVVLRSRGKLDEFDETIAPRRRAESVAESSRVRQHSPHGGIPRVLDDCGVSRGSMDVAWWPRRP